MVAAPIAPWICLYYFCTAGVTKSGRLPPSKPCVPGGLVMLSLTVFWYRLDLRQHPDWPSGKLWVKTRLVLILLYSLNSL